MEYFVPVMIGVLSIFVMFILWNNGKEEVLRLAVMAVIYYLMLYVMISGFFLGVGCYSVKVTLIVVSLILLCLFLLTIINKKADNILIKRNVSRDWLSYLVILGILIITYEQFDYFGMGQDEGVYQVKAINLAYGETSEIQNIPEYDSLPDSEYRTFYRDQLWSLAGYDIVKWGITETDQIYPGMETTPDILLEGVVDDVSGRWHGIPTFPALLALSIKVFGLRNIALIQCVFWGCFLFLLQFVLSNLKLKTTYQSILLLVIGLSPEMIWVKKSTLAELFLALLIMFFLYYILHPDKTKRVLSVLPLVVYSFIHVSFFAFLPAFIIIYWFLSVWCRQKKYLYCAGILTTGYLLSFLMMILVQPRYTLLNYSRNIHVPGGLVVPLVICAGIAVMIANFVIGKIRQQNFDQILLEKYIKVGIQVFCVTDLVILLISFFQRRYSLLTSIHFTFIAECAFSGCVLIPLILFLLIIKKYELSEESFALLLLFLWCIVIYSTFMVPNTDYYYYYGRYLVPFLGVAAVFFAYLFRKRNCFWWILAFVGFCTMMPFSMTVLRNKDDSKVEWGVLERILEESKKAENILIDPDLMPTFYFPVKAIANANVYPVLNTVEETLNYLNIEKKSVWYLSKSDWEGVNNWLKVDCRFVTTCQEQNDPTVISEFWDLPMSIPEQRQYKISLYEYQNVSKNIDCFDDEAFFSGWTERNTVNFRWMNAKTSLLVCYLQRGGYFIKISTGDKIPFQNISEQEIRTSFFINDYYVQDIVFSEENYAQGVVLYVPKECIKDGLNIIRFENELWSPQEYGSIDASCYGVSIDRIDFFHE